MTSLVTRCPACTTLFKVVPDQLRISEGWVRCGQCDEVFDANVHMQPAIPMEHESVAAPPLATSVDADQPRDDGGLGGAAPVANSIASEDALLTASTEPDESAITQVIIGSDKLDAPHASLDEALTPGVGWGGDGDDPGGDSPEAPPPGFMQSTRAVGARARWPDWLVVVILVLGLSGQWLVHERDRIAAMQPALQPWLEHTCSLLGCAVRPMRRIDAVVIESSSFVKVKSDVYRLAFAVRNTAAWPLAMPSAELTLTNVHDQSVFRRVLSPAELTVPRATLEAGEELSVMVPIAVRGGATTNGEKVGGYRLLVFYP